MGKGVIYSIRNTKTNQYYVGATTQRATRRWADHLLRLRKGDHPTNKLQHAWTSYGERYFEFVVLEEVENPRVLPTREKHWMEALNSIGNGYNGRGIRRRLLPPIIRSDKETQRANGVRNCLQRWGPKDDLARLWRNVNKDGPPFANKGPCWIFTGTLNRGYGLTTWGEKQKLVHIIVYTLLVGPVPNGKELDHLCRNRSCVNPDHLDPVTHKENMRRTEKATKEACVRGHTDGWYIVQGCRRCRICERIRDKERIPRRRAQRQAARARTSTVRYAVLNEWPEGREWVDG